MKKNWLLPKLMIFVRSRPGSLSQLEYCKAGGIAAGAAMQAGGCYTIRRNDINVPTCFMCNQGMRS